MCQAASSQFNTTHNILSLEPNATSKNKRKKKMAPQENNGGEILEAKIAELIKTKEELKKAKEVATQSWLDSRPLIDKLERSKSRLSNCQSRFSASNKFISELESELKRANESIKSKKAEELETRRNKTEIRMNIDQTKDWRY